MQIRTFLPGCAILAALTPACSRPASESTTAPSAPTPPAAAKAASTPPKLVVLVVVDQLPSWWFEARRQHFHGGTERLIRQGVYYPQAAYPYAVTFTAAGHAALGTGAPPSVTGIADNERFDPNYTDESKREVATARDEASAVFVMADPGADPQPPGYSSKALGVDGIADVLRSEQPAARSVTVSLKDRSAVFMAGREPDLAIWYDDKQGAMTTGTFYVRPGSREADEVLPWLRQRAQKDRMAKYFDTEWERSPRLDHEAITGGKDLQEGETVTEGGLDGQFPHHLKELKDMAARAKHLNATPAGDLLLFETAFAAIEHMSLGADGVTDYLGISFSAQDLAGHYWGPDSWERLDIFARFDQELDAFLGKLDGRFGAGGYALILTSDHGVTPLVEYSQAQGYVAHRIRRDDIMKAAECAARRVLESEAAGAKCMSATKLESRAWIAHVNDNALYIRTKAFEALPEARREAALDAVARAIRELPGMLYVRRAKDITEGGCEQRTDIDRLMCYSVVPEQPGDMYFAAAPRSITTKYPQGTNHGSPNLYDRLVPIIVYAPGDARWNTPRVVREQVSTLQVAPTLAGLLGVSAPRNAMEKTPLP